MMERGGREVRWKGGKVWAERAFVYVLCLCRYGLKVVYCDTGLLMAVRCIDRGAVVA